MNVLVFNAGSASLKFEVVKMPVQPISPSEGKKLVSGIVEGIGGESVLSLLRGKDVDRKEPFAAKDYHEAARRILEWLEQPYDAIGHRVVHGADCFTEAVVIDDGAIRDIEALEDLAPLHNAPAVEVIKAAREASGFERPMVAGFDTVFHQSLPPEAYTYALPAEVAKRLRIRRYGFHGLSHEYLLHRYCELTQKRTYDATIVTLHLESGSSACAIREGQSVETSMGFTPLEGLVMGMRCGDIDPALVTYLARKEKLDLDSLNELLNKKSGLKGLSGVSHDTRELMEHLDDPQVKLALEVFCHRIVKYVGAYLALLNGATAIVFGGGIGEDSPWIRARVSKAFEWCGLTLDAAANERVINREARISVEGSRLEAYVIPTEEGLSLAYQTVRAISRKPEGRSRPVSAPTS